MVVGEEDQRYRPDLGCPPQRGNPHRRPLFKGSNNPQGQLDSAPGWAGGVQGIQVKQEKRPRQQ